VFLNEKWVPVSPTKNAFVVNIGDLYERWTNKRWTSTLHRVANPPADSEASKRSRHSFPFFTGPNFESLIEPLATCIDEEHP
jgi:isopenicillin N synthase-like dioxygenase